MIINIQQAIYGELDSSKGYHLLNSSFKDSSIARRLSNITDLIDRPPNSILSKPVFRAFSIGEYFLFIKTFPDSSTNVRSGRVFSHVLIIEINELIEITNLKPLLEFHLEKVDKYLNLEPIQLDISDSKKNTIKFASPQLASAINGLVNHNQFNNTIVWLGEEGYIDWISQIWLNIPNLVKPNIKLGVGYNPQKIDKTLLNLIYIPKEIKQNWLNYNFKIVDRDKIEDYETQTSNLLAGNIDKAKELDSLINDFKLQINEIDDLLKLERVLPTYISISESKELAPLLIFVDLISKFSPKKQVVLEKKIDLLNKVITKFKYANSKEINAIPNIDWSIFPNYKSVLSNALIDWLNNKLFFEENNIEIAKILEKTYLGNQVNWWHDTIKIYFDDKIANSNEEYIILIINWFNYSPKLIKIFESLLPDQIEKSFTSNINKIDSKILKNLEELAIDKNWIIFHANILSKLYPIDIAINKQLEKDNSESNFEGLQVLASNFSAESFIDYSSQDSTKKLIDFCIKLIDKNPKLLSRIKVTNQGWIDIWSICELKNISAYHFVNDPLELTYNLLNEYLKGKDINYSLLLKISNSNYNDLSGFSARTKLWKSLSNPIKSNFVNGTSSLTKLQKFLISNEFSDVEEKLINKKVEEEYIKKIISNNQKVINSGLILGLFEQFLFQEELFLIFLSKRYAEFDYEIARRVGELIKRREWKESYKAIRYNYVIYNKSLNVAIEINTSLFSFKSLFSWDSNKDKNAKPMNSTNVNIDSNKKILIVVATPLEAKMVLSQMKENGYIPIPQTINKMVFWHLGEINGSNLIMQKTTTMGSSGPGGSSLSVQDAISIIKPDAVVMLGIAFGLKKDKQKIGTVLVSKQIEGYELSKIKENSVIQRADKIPASHSLVNMFENAEFDFAQCDLEFGLMVSGEKLVDNEEFVNRLKISYPEAIGGEMEGEGLQSACHRNGVDWILMKGICDWGFNKNTPSKNDDQKLAISNACDFLLYTLERFKL